MQYSKIIAAYSQIHTKHINTLCGQNSALFEVESGGTYSNHWAFKGWNKACGSRSSICDIKVCRGLQCAPFTRQSALYYHFVQH